MPVTKTELIQKNFRLTALNSVRKPGLYLVGEFMHGDADTDTTQDWEMESVEEWYAVKKYLEWRRTFHHNADISYRQKGESEDDFYAQTGEEWRSSYLWDGLIDWWDRDVTSDGDIRASLEDYYLVYSDGEHEWRVSK